MIIYERARLLELSNIPLSIPKNANFNFDIGFDRKKFGHNGKNEWKRRERPPPLIRKANAWVPNRLKFDKTKVDAISNKVKNFLNKISNKNYDKILSNLLELEIDDAFCLNTVVNEIFKKAIIEPTFCKIYSKICIEMSEKFTDYLDTDFRRLLLAHCQSGFIDRKLPDEEYQMMLRKKELTGTARLIGELFNQDMISENVIFDKCMNDLIDLESPMELDLEILATLIKVSGNKIDKDIANKKSLDNIFAKVKEIVDAKKVGSRMKFMYMDLTDSRKKGWQ